MVRAEADRPRQGWPSHSPGLNPVENLWVKNGAGTSVLQEYERKQTKDIAVTRKSKASASSRHVFKVIQKLLCTPAWVRGKERRLHRAQKCGPEKKSGPGGQKVIESRFSPHPGVTARAAAHADVSCRGNVVARFACTLLYRSAGR